MEKSTKIGKPRAARDGSQDGALTLVLFDIDGTLIHTGGAGTRAMVWAFEAVTRIRDGFREVPMAGKTDPQIVQEGLRFHGLPVDPVLRDRILAAYLSRLPVELARGTGRVLEGVEALLSRLQQQPRVRLGLLTGNLEAGARIKLQHFGLWRYFALGAFGSDAEDRNALLPVALHRFYEKEGVRLPPEQVVVIGDTPRDVACCRPHGAVAVAVASGPYPPEALAQARPDLLLPDLRDPAPLLAYLESRRR